MMDHNFSFQNPRELQLEIERLTDAFLDKQLSEDDAQQLHSLLAHSEEAREYYIRTMQWNTAASEVALLNAEVSGDAECLQNNGLHNQEPQFSLLSKRNLLMVAGFAIAATMLLMFTPSIFRPQYEPSVLETGDSIQKYTSQFYIAEQISFETSRSDPSDKSSLRAGDIRKIESGIAEFVFASGAIAKVPAPAVLRIDSAWKAELLAGNVIVTVPPQAIGFQLETEESKLLDLGTQFAVNRDDTAQCTHIKVLSGSVEVQEKSRKSGRTRVLKTNESQCISSNGFIVTDSGDTNRFHFIDAVESRGSSVRSVSLSRSVVCHFEQVDRRPALSEKDFEKVVVPLNTPSGQLEIFDALSNRSDYLLGQGKSGNGLRLDGVLFGKLVLPDEAFLAERIQIAFWINSPGIEAVPPEGSIVSLALPNSQQSNDRTFVDVMLCRTPVHGPLGSVSISFDDLAITASTVVSDGKWNEVIVELQRNATLPTKWQATIRVNGRLDGITSIHRNPIYQESPIPSSQDGSTNLTTKGTPKTQIQIGKSVNDAKASFIGQLDELQISW